MTAAKSSTCTFANSTPQNTISKWTWVILRKMIGIIIWDQEASISQTTIFTPSERAIHLCNIPRMTIGSTTTSSRHLHTMTTDNSPIRKVTAWVDIWTSSRTVVRQALTHDRPVKLIIHTTKSSIKGKHTVLINNWIRDGTQIPFPKTRTGRNKCHKHRSNRCLKR